MMGSINQENLKHLEQFGNSIKKQEKIVNKQSVKKNKATIKKKHYSLIILFFHMKKDKIWYVLQQKMKLKRPGLSVFKKSNNNFSNNERMKSKKRLQKPIRLHEKKYQFGSMTILIRKRKRYSVKPYNSFDAKSYLMDTIGYDMKSYGSSSLFDVDIFDD